MPRHTLAKRLAASAVIAVPFIFGAQLVSVAWVVGLVIVGVAYAFLASWALTVVTDWLRGE